MTDERKCTVCGATLGAEAAEGACPRCLLAEGLSDGSPDAAELAEHFPALELKGLVGRGGMGIVYRARQKTLDRVVALKILPPEVADGPGFSDRFLREARAMAKLDHPNIVRIHDFGETDGLPWLIMEYVDGVNLRQLMAEGVEPAQALAIVPQVCDALQYAHDRGIVHRDVKPENILVDREGKVKITDFGLAKLLDRGPTDSSLTGTGQVMGTVHYMAPEQYRTPGDVDHRADIYSLGVVFYEMLTGQLPVGRFDPPSRRVQVDVRLDDVVLRALESERERRYQRADEVRTEVDAISRTDAPAPTPTPDRAPAPREPARLSGMAVAGALGVLLAASLAIAGSLLIAIAKPAGVSWSIVFVAVALLALTITVCFVLSLVALVRISRSDGRLRGRGFAWTGILVSTLLLVVFVAVMLLTVFAGVEPPREATPASGPVEIFESPPAPEPPRMPWPKPDEPPESERDAVLRAVRNLPASAFADSRDYEILRTVLDADPEIDVELDEDRARVTIRGRGRELSLSFRNVDAGWKLGR